MSANFQLHEWDESLEQWSEPGSNQSMNLGASQDVRRYINLRLD